MLVRSCELRSGIDHDSRPVAEPTRKTVVSSTCRLPAGPLRYARHTIAESDAQVVD
jgi:hypothetical protein